MKRLRLTLRLLKRNWKALLGFEALYKLSVTTVFTPLLVAVFSLTIRASGLTYLSADTVRAYLLHPVTIVCLLFMLLLTAFVSLFDMQAVICCCDASRQNRDITMGEMMLEGFDNAKRVLSPRNWFLIVFVVLIVPLTNAGAVSGLISRIELPEFIEDYINANTLLHILRVCATLLLSLLAFRWCFSLHAFTLGKESYAASCRESARLMKKHMISVALGTVGMSFLLELLLFLAGCAVVGIVFLGIRFLCPANLQFPAATYTLLGTVTIGSYLSLLLTVPASFAYLSVRFYQLEAGGREPADAPVFQRPVRGKAAARWACAALCMAILGGVALQFIFSGDMRDATATARQQPEVAAHRGSSVARPENSMPAFRQAIDDGADWIELDVHQTKDNVVVVTHDESIKRIAGVAKNVWELTYEELEQYDAGSWFSPEYADIRVATLDEVLKLCKGKIKLNIELKPTGHEPDFEKHVLERIHANGYEEGEYILASLNADALKTVKRLEPEVKTLYIMTFAAGNVHNIPFADAYSIEESSINARLVSSVHGAGKQLYAWTVNRAENVENLSELGVDCIISDDPVMAKAALMAAPLSDDLQSIVTLFFPGGGSETTEEAERAIFAGKLRVAVR